MTILSVRVKRSLTKMIYLLILVSEKKKKNILMSTWDDSKLGSLSVRVFNNFDAWLAKPLINGSTE